MSASAIEISIKLNNKSNKTRFCIITFKFSLGTKLVFEEEMQNQTAAFQVTIK